MELSIGYVAISEEQTVWACNEKQQSCDEYSLRESAAIFQIGETSKYKWSNAKTMGGDSARIDTSGLQAEQIPVGSNLNSSRLRQTLHKSMCPPLSLVKQ